MTAVLDDTLLDDTARLLEADRSGALRAVATAGAQMRATATAADDAGVRSLEGLRPRALVLLTRPGPSEAAARIVAALIAPTCPMPLVVTDTAPPWLGPLDVLVATHRGREADPAEAEVARTVDQAVRRGAHVVLTGPAEGPAAAAGAGRALAVVPRLPVSEDLATAAVLATLFAVTTALGLLPVDAGALADRLDAEAERDGPRGEAFVNPAKTLALRLAERSPLLWGVDAVAGAVAGYGAQVLATHAGVVAQATTLAAAVDQPALHARLTATTSVDAVFADPFDDPAGAGEPPRLVLVAVREDVTTRRTVADASSRWPVADMLEIDDLDLAGDGATHDAVRASVLATRLDFTALYLGLATGAHAAGVRTG